MREILNDIMIIFDGKPLACKMATFSESREYMSMLLSALTSFAEEIHEGQLTNVEFTNLRFNIVKRHGIVFFAISKRTIPLKKASEHLQKIADDFFDKFPPELLSNWNGELAIFSEFEESLSINRSELIAEKISQMWREYPN